MPRNLILLLGAAAVSAALKPTSRVSPVFKIVSGRMTDNIVRAGLNDKFY